MMVDISNFVFDQIIGVKLKGRICTLIASHNNRQDDDIICQPAARARQLSRQSDLPRPVRRFFAQFSKVKSRENFSIYDSIIDNINDLYLFQRWTHICRLAGESDPGIVNFLSAYGVRKSRASRVRHVLADMLYLSRDQLNDYCERGKSISQMTETFGDGILILLPANASDLQVKSLQSPIVQAKSVLYSLNEFGVWMIANAIPIIDRLLPQLRVLSKLASFNILDPILKGHDLEVDIPVEADTARELLDFHLASYTENVADEWSVEYGGRSEESGYIHGLEESEYY